MDLVSKMWQFLLTLFVIAVSTSFITADKNPYCKKHFHEICGSSDVITFVNQTMCSQTTFCDDSVYQKGCNETASCDDDDEDNSNFCQYLCRHINESRLILNLEDFSAIAPYAFRAANSFTTLSFISKSKDCVRKMIELEPESFDGLSSVQILELDCVKFTLKPDPFETLKSVEELHMSRMKSRELPKYFFSDFPNLRILQLWNFDVVAVTPNTFRQINQELQQLLLKSNNLSVIEEKSFAQFRKLKDLRITYNQLTDLRTGVFHGLNCLEVLRVSTNRITVLHRNTFGRLPMLKDLRLSNNRISNIEVEAFSGLPIVRLDLEHNELGTWPVGAFKNLKNLRGLSLHSNKISILSHDMFEGLQGSGLNIDLSNNNILHIEQNTFWGLHLVNLFLENNELTVLNPNTFNGLRCQGRLELSYNRIMSIKEHAFRNLTVKSISLQGNPITAIDKANWGVNDSVSIQLIYQSEYFNESSQLYKMFK